MYETPEDLERLQRLLDDSYRAAGPHLRSVITEERRLTAERLAGMLDGVQLLHLATVTAAGEPRVSPVDGLFYRGRFWFGSGHDSARFRHIRKRPQVSASLTHGEELGVTVHGRAEEVDLRAPESESAGFRDLLLEVYGRGWLDWGGTAPYARIESAKMFTFYLPKEEAERLKQEAENRADAST